MKNTLRLILIFCALASSFMTATAQRSPQHPFDFGDVQLNDFASYFDNWTAGTQPQGVSLMNDQFYISRVRPLERIVDGDYFVRGTTVSRDRKLCMWVPLDDPTATWKAFPRYCFEGDNFSMWSYVDIHGNWTAPWFRSSAGITDVAHKNGVKVGCVLSIPYSENITLNSNSTTSATVLNKLIEKNSDDTFKHSLQLVKLLKYYGIDGIGVNSEFRSNATFMRQLIAFFSDCHKKAKEIGSEFQVHWYDGTGTYGNITFDAGLANHNQAMFGTGEDPIVDMMFFNYNWTQSILTSSQTKATQMGRSSYDLYAGFDIQGRAFKNENWTALKNSNISIGLWGAHSQSLLHQSATDNGTSDIAIQKAYQEKLELTFSGGNRNPQTVPSIKTDATLSNSDLKSFHGLATLLTAKSTIQQVPFVTRFNLGNGLSFRNEGKVTFNHKWYNLNTQDFLPTWRWWITDNNNRATTSVMRNLIHAELTFDDAYFGGSCLRIFGATPYSRVKLFKTMLRVEPNYNFSVTYKMPKAGDSHAKLFVALKNDVRNFKDIDLPATTADNEWTTFTTTAESLQLAAGDSVAMIGIAVENSDADYELFVGELALRNPAQTFAPVKPEIKEVQLLRGRFNALDFKIRYASKEESGEEKTFNDEVDTWYYEIFFQQEGQPEYLLTATTSWAAYVIDAPLVPGMEGRNGRFGVRAVSPDGLQKSEIAWTSFQSIPYNETVSDVVIDKQIIKAGETFTVGLLDVMGQPAQEWKIVDPVTGNVMATSKNTLNCQTSINKEGLYDLYFTDSNGSTTITRGMIQITPLSTGAVPTVEAINPNVETATTDDEVTFTYAGRKGEGAVSRGLRIADPEMFMVPGELQQGKTYSYALWFKADDFTHDKQGTNLINKNSIADSWPHNNWGDLWVTIRPAYTKGTTFGGEASTKLQYDHAANEISFNTMGWTAHDGPNEAVMTTNHSVTPGVWNHVVVTQNDNLQKIYFNGEKIGETNCTTSTRREDLSQSDSRIKGSVTANIFIGGGGVYKAGFNGWIDEVQVWNKALTDQEVLTAMKGFVKEEVPDGLQAYYTFEEISSDGTFENLGKGGNKPGKIVVTAGSGGESTSSAAYEQRTANNEGGGYAGIPGSLEVKTEALWDAPSATVKSETENGANIQFAEPGTYQPSLTLKNIWGEATATSAKTVTITPGTGIKNIESATETVVLTQQRNSVTLQFAESGAYEVTIVSAAGQKVRQQHLQMRAGENAIVHFNAPQGTYVLSVRQNGHLLKAMKVQKR